MARYDYRCRTCDERFEVERPMTADVAATPCSSGHLDTVKLLSSFATVGAASGTSPAPVAAGGGGCCGGACGCR
jgi:putative FmdB family regulatory protein